MHVVALIWGILAMVGLSFGLIPCLGWLNWINIPFAFFGVIIGLFGVALANNQGQPLTLALVGLTLSTMAVVVGAVRLVLGGFLL
jgi:hypothetical protein